MFGAPTDQPDHAERAVACALALDAYAEAFRARWRDKGVVIGVTRIGINSGPALVGNFGGGRFFDYAAYGDTLSIAARLETANKQLGTRICVSDSVVQRIPGFHGRPVGIVRLRGRSEALTAHEPLTQERHADPLTVRISRRLCQSRGLRSSSAVRFRCAAGARQQRWAGELPSEAAACRCRRRRNGAGMMTFFKGGGWEDGPRSRAGRGDSTLSTRQGASLRQRKAPMRAIQDSAIADLRRQLEECRAERDAALAREAALAEVMDAINRSPGDLTPVFQAIVEKAHTLCNAAYGSLQLWNGEKFRAVALRGFSGEMSERLQQGYSPYPDMPCRSLVEGERVAHCIDLAQIDDPTARSGVELGGVRTILYVALRKDNTLLGQIVAARREVRPFKEKEIALVENFADQAVVAMENARLLTEQREALEQQTATAEILQAINELRGDLTRVFDAMLEKAMRLCQAAFGELHTFDGERYVPGVTKGVPAPYSNYRAQHTRGGAIRLGTIFDRIRSGLRYVHITDLMSESLYHDGDPGRHAMVHLGGARTLLAVPLRRGDACLGLIAIYRKEVRPFSDKQIALLENFAVHAGIAIENVRLLSELRQRTHDLQEALETRQQPATC